jgi:predicted secreted hydrolase
LVIVGKDGSLDQRSRDDFQWEPQGQWMSPRTQASYPIRARITTGSETFELRPLALDQEQGGSLTGLPYWEGACDVLDAEGKVIGRAFLELAGYAGDLRRHLRGEVAK